jgi:hypothetical protein
VAVVVLPLPLLAAAGMDAGKQMMQLAQLSLKLCLGSGVVFLVRLVVEALAPALTQGH